jgi:hypothetical protein
MNEATDTMEISHLAERAKLLSPADRQVLIDELVISLDGEPDADPLAIERAWDEEITRRAAILLPVSEAITQRAIELMEALTLSHGLQMGDALTLPQRASLLDDSGVRF